ncbi:SAM-dependent methyltransferase [Saccharothrix isguenensis]
MSDLDWVPAGIDVTVPSVAMTYDYLLGDAHNRAVDRPMGGRMLVHEIVREVARGCRVVHVDKDPVAVAHGRLLPADDGNTTAVQADLGEAEDVLSRPEMAGPLDFDEPVVLLLLLVVHFVRPEEEPGDLLARYRDRLAPGSFMAISHATADDRSETMARAADTVRESRSEDNLVSRTHAEVTSLFDGYELVEPGVVGHALWRPGGVGDSADRAEDNTRVWAGVGREPVAGGR